MIHTGPNYVQESSTTAETTMTGPISRCLDLMAGITHYNTPSRWEKEYGRNGQRGSEQDDGKEKARDASRLKFSAFFFLFYSYFTNHYHQTITGTQTMPKRRISTNQRQFQSNHDDDGFTSPPDDDTCLCDHQTTTYTAQCRFKEVCGIVIIS